MEITNWVKQLLGLVLHVANTSPPILGRSEFYKLKTQLLQRHGRLVAHDWQHIVKPCWGPDERGCGEKGCYRCRRRMYKPGVWMEFYVWLERWQLGGYEFHVPRERVYQYEGKELDPRPYNVIEGYINHDRYPNYLSKECALWLFLIFWPSVFREVFPHSGINLKYGRTPLVIIGHFCYLFESMRRRQYELAHSWDRRETDTDRWLSRLQQDRYLADFEPPF